MIVADDADRKSLSGSAAMANISLGLWALENATDV